MSVKRDMLDHWVAVSDRYTAVEEFLVWCSATYSLDFDFVRADRGTPRLRRLLDEFFEVDQRKLDQQRSELMRMAQEVG